MGVMKLVMPGAVLGDRHGDLPGRTGVPVADEAAVRLVGDIPEGNARLGKEIRDRHERRSDDAERVLDAMHLQDLYEGFFSSHLGHGSNVLLPRSDAMRPATAGQEQYIASRLIAVWADDGLRRRDSPR